MHFFQWDRNPWGEEVLVRISWDLFWASAIVGALFVIGHLVYRAKFAPAEDEASGETAKVEGIPDRVVRHSPASRLFHWTMSVAVFALLITGFFPVLGIQFNWLAVHWISGLVLIGLIIFHIIHSSFWLDLKNIWISSADWKEWVQEVKHGLGKGEPPPKPGKYPVDHRIFHHMSALATLGVIGTGVLMLFRIDTPLFARNPYLMSDASWGLVYVLHGLSAVALVGMIITHVYFAVLPEKRWITISMIAGWITRKDFLAHHDPKRWVVERKES